MRLRIEHETTYDYEERPKGLIQVLRLAPRGFVGQHVVRWRIEPSLDGALRRSEDALGNILHRFVAESAGERLTIRVTGVVETDESHGVVRGVVERAPDLYFLRATQMTAPSGALVAFAEEAAGSEREKPLAALHAINAGLCERLAMERGPADSAVGAAEAFGRGRGLPQDLAHAFVAAARHFGIPARNVSGYLYDSDEENGGGGGGEEPDRESSRGHVHAWAEAKVAGLGWVAFDPSFGACAGPSYVRVAIGLDAQGCAPVRGARYGGGDESLSVRLSITDMRARGRPNPDGKARSNPGSEPPGQTQSQSRS